jgi:alkanesulfonate monooxygenase SsuD/methylene tetrahydromethanopterin reductase-like flavin-dependent oxidoreductase (luciferase family)
VLQRSVFWLLDHYAETGERPEAVHATALEHARLADELGYRSLWLAEHHFVSLGTAPNPAVVLAAIAQCTRNLRIGAAVAVLPLRSPIQLAEDYALVDILSGGRLNMGVGSGAQPLEFEGLGCDFDERRASFDKNLAEIRARWATAASGERGPSSLNVAPVQSPAPPIYVATMSEEGARAVGLQGDSMLTLVSPATADADEVAARVAAHAGGLRDGGHAEGSAEVVAAAFAHVADSEQEAEEICAPALGRFVEAMAGAAPPDPGALYRSMKERGTGLFGDTEHVARQIERWAELGIRHIAFVSRFGGMSPEAAERSLRRLAPAG